jgi:hypothetical protein
MTNKGFSAKIECSDEDDADLLTKNPLFGLWQDRDEIRDVAAFARQLRAQNSDTSSKKRSANLTKKSR